MGKKKKKKKLRARIPSITIRDRHHICWERSTWSSGHYARLICETFVRYVPVVYHREIHARMKRVPVPSEELLKEAWEKYQKNSAEIDSYDVARAAAWLYVNIPDEEFRKAMQYQIDFFATRFEKTV